MLISIEFFNNFADNLYQNDDSFLKNSKTTTPTTEKGINCLVNYHKIQQKIYLHVSTCIKLINFNTPWKKTIKIWICLIVFLQLSFLIPILISFLSNGWFNSLTDKWTSGFFINMITSLFVDFLSLILIILVKYKNVCFDYFIRCYNLFTHLMQIFYLAWQKISSMSPILFLP